MINQLCPTPAAGCASCAAMAQNKNLMTHGWRFCYGGGPMNSIAILGSARKSKSNTAVILRRLIAGTQCDVVDLKVCSIAPYNYDHEYPDSDEFATVIHQVVYAPV